MGQHSDRLARGDGRVARHAVEIALWALKRDVRVRTIQDPDTFRDLIYAVVTGQRNHEDSRRKGLASAAGRRRALERGEYTGTRPDGYRLAVELDDKGAVRRRLELDPQRQPMIELIFRLALRGKTSGVIARALNDAGWHTKPRIDDQQPQTWNAAAVLQILHNPRYAGVTATKGEIVAPAHWPAYITVSQHQRIQALIAERLRERQRTQENQAFLLSRLLQCGRCGEPVGCHAGLPRADRTFARRYICRSHSRDRHRERCQALPIDAERLERMFVASLRHLLHEPPNTGGLVETIEPFDGHWTKAPERERLRSAALGSDEERFDQAIERMVARVAPELALQRRAAATRAHTRQLALEQRFDIWTQGQGRPASSEMRRETIELNSVLYDWFSQIRVQNTITETVITAQRKAALPADRTPPPVEVRLDRREWIRAAGTGGRDPRPQALWSDEEIIASLQEWAARHGRSPNSCEWITGSPDRPGSLCVRRRFGSWARALKRAGLKPNTRTQHRYWTDQEILNALRHWTTDHGRPPKAKDWTQATPAHPCARTVAQHYGTFATGVLAAQHLRA